MDHIWLNNARWGQLLQLTPQVLKQTQHVRRWYLCLSIVIPSRYLHQVSEDPGLQLLFFLRPQHTTFYQRMGAQTRLSPHFFTILAQYWYPHVLQGRYSVHCAWGCYVSTLTSFLYFQQVYTSPGLQWIVICGPTHSTYCLLVESQGSHPDEWGWMRILQLIARRPQTS